MSLKGRTFRFNGNITRYPDSGKGFLVVREVNNVKEYFFTDSEGNKYKEFEEAEKLYYVGEYPPSASDATITVWQNDTWLNDKYKTITFIEEPTGFTQNAMPYTRTEEEFEQFLLYNCTEVISEIETITDFDGKVHHLRDETVPSLMAAKADKVSSATNGNFAALDGNGNLIDSGHKHSDYLTQHQDISSKVSGPSSAVNNQVAVFDGTTGKAIKGSGFTIGKSVPSDAVFTDTWRPIEGTTANPSVDAAFSSIAGNALNNNIIGVAVPNGDCNNATATGRYLTSLSTANAPSASHWVIDVIKYNDNEISQIARNVYGNNVVSTRAKLNGTWSTWEELALKSNHEINTFVKQVNSGANATFTMSDCCIVYVMRQTSGTYGIYFVDRWGGVQPAISATNISVSCSNSIITVSNNSSNAIQCVCMIK